MGHFWLRVLTLCVCLHTQVSFRSVFQRYDTSGRGTFSPVDLARMVKDVTPNATNAQIKIFLVRVCNGNSYSSVPVGVPHLLSAH